MDINSDIHQIHDTYFKFVFGDVKNVRSFLEEFFPELARHIIIETIETQPTEKFSIDCKERQYLDFVVNCKIKDVNSKIYFIFEHKSNPDKRVIIQLVKYIISAWEEDILNSRDITPIIPIVFYNGNRKWRVDRSTLHGFQDFPDYIKQYLLRMEYLLFDTNKLTDLDIKRRLNRNRMLMLALDVMRQSSKEFVDEDEVIGLFKELADLLLEHEKDFKEHIAMFLEMSIIYIQHSKRLGIESLNKLFVNREDRRMKTIIDLWKEEGLKQGLQEGLQQGLQQGLAEGLNQGSVKEAQEMVLSAIEAKFDYIPEGIEHNIRSIQDRGILHNLLKKIIKANDLSEIISNLN